MTKKIQLRMSPSQAEEQLLILANIVLQLRARTKHWDEHFGFAAKQAKIRWEVNADKWIDENVQITETD